MGRLVINDFVHFVRLVREYSAGHLSTGNQAAESGPATHGGNDDIIMIFQATLEPRRSLNNLRRKIDCYRDNYPHKRNTKKLGSE